MENTRTIRAKINRVTLFIGTHNDTQTLCATELLREIQSSHSEDHCNTAQTSKKRKWNTQMLEEPIQELYKYKWSPFNFTTNPSKDRDKVEVLNAKFVGFMTQMIGILQKNYTMNQLEQPDSPFTHEFQVTRSLSEGDKPSQSLM
mmetsp:Transcript_10535/g.14419  ORF Transcript_10535/g.14419 Transcript_10535/m.14419 type:complete len:145 (+) Transcript_10535:267-701(+)